MTFQLEYIELYKVVYIVLQDRGMVWREIWQDKVYPNGPLSSPACGEEFDKIRYMANGPLGGTGLGRIL